MRSYVKQSCALIVLALSLLLSSYGCDSNRDEKTGRLKENVLHDAIVVPKDKAKDVRSKLEAAQESELDQAGDLDEDEAEE